MLAKPPILPNEKALFARIANSDEAAFTEVFHHYNQRLYPFVLKMIKLDHLAEEIVQDVFLNLWRRRQHLVKVESPQSYIFRMATNRTLDQMQQVSRDSALITDLMNAMDQLRNNEIEEWFDGKVSAELINDAIDNLPPQRKLVYKLVKEEGKSYKEVGDQLNISPKTVHAHIVDAVKSIKEYLKKTPGGSLAMLIFIVELSNR